MAFAGLLCGTGRVQVTTAKSWLEHFQRECEGAPAGQRYWKLGTPPPPHPTTPAHRLCVKLICSFPPARPCSCRCHRRTKQALLCLLRRHYVCFRLLAASGNKGPSEETCTVVSRNQTWDLSSVKQQQTSVSGSDSRLAWPQTNFPTGLVFILSFFSRVQVNIAAAATVHFTLFFYFIFMASVLQKEVQLYKNNSLLTWSLKVDIATPPSYQT